MDQLYKRIANLSPKQREFLIAHFGNNLPETEAPLISRVDERRTAPLSFAQQRLWFLDQLEPGNPAYNLPAAVRLSGRLEVAALARTFNEIRRRHEVLRTAFISREGRAVQEISAQWQEPLPLIDLSGLSLAAREAEATRLAQSAAQEGFELRQAPLMRVRLLRLRAEEHLLLLVMHHIVSDGWSMGILVREVSELYGAYRRGERAALAELPIQYGDYAVWQREYLGGAVLEKQLSYWREQLQGVGVLELPTDHVRPVVQSYRGGHEGVWVAEEVSAGLRELSGSEGVTLYMVLLAAFKVLLSLYSGAREVVVGSPVAGRNRTEVEGLIGFFINTLVLRSEVRGEESFREMLRREREVVLEAYAHQEVPFEKLVEELQPERSLSHSPLFQVMFIMQNKGSEAVLSLGGLEIDLLPVNSGTVKYDLTLNMSEYQNNIGGTLQYNADLFDAATVERMSGNLQTLLRAISSNPDEQLSRLPLLTESDRQQVLVEWNATVEDYPRDKCIHQLFEAQAEHRPDAVAVVFEDRQLTYGELNRRANQLAHLLLKLGVKQEVLVGICLERSLEMLIGVLGVLKAGGAYVPLDPLFPRQRLAYMLDDAGVSVLLTQQHIAAQLDARTERFICLERDLESIEGENGENPGALATPDNLAYVIYTSGSTGQPKGVQISHGSVINFLSSMRRQPGLMPQDTLLAITTLSFDIAGLELFLPLVVGGRVVIAGRDALTDTARFIELIEDSGATVMQATPAIWRLLVDVGWSGNDKLKILCGGEALPKELVDELIERGESVWNMFGPTETTIWSTTCQVEPGQSAVYIGGPIANTQVYVLRQDMQPAPIGLPGELYIGGDGLARGYLNAPEPSAQRFVPDPFSTRPGARLYRTGDAALYLPDGSLRFLGRLDHQVKIRGHRIELGEIEMALSLHPSLREVVVVARVDVPGDKRLVAYVVAAREQSPPTVNELRRHLREQLPDYMIPAAFVVLPALPLTPNGKVNRLALPSPEKLRPELEAAYTPPRTEAERLIASLWQEVLGLEQVGMDDNFFDLGGHSLLTIQVHLKLRERFAKELTIIDVFKYPTVSMMAGFLSQETDAKNSLPSDLQRGANRKASMRRRRELKQRQHTAVASGDLI